jgi:hypothetical protein
VDEYSCSSSSEFYHLQLRNFRGLQLLVTYYHCSSSFAGCYATGLGASLSKARLLHLRVDGLSDGLPVQALSSVSVSICGFICLVFVAQGLLQGEQRLLGGHDSLLHLVLHLLPLFLRGVGGRLTASDGRGLGLAVEVEEHVDVARVVHVGNQEEHETREDSDSGIHEARRILVTLKIYQN